MTAGGGSHSLLPIHHRGVVASHICTTASSTVIAVIVGHSGDIF
jgi:hypothetical protein